MSQDNWREDVEEAPLERYVIAQWPSGNVGTARRRDLQYHRNPERAAKWMDGTYRTCAPPVLWQPFPSPRVRE